MVCPTRSAPRYRSPSGFLVLADPRHARHFGFRSFALPYGHTLLSREPAGVPAGDTQALPPSLRGMLYPSGIGRALSPRRGLIACCRNPRESRDSEALTLSFGRSVLRCFAGPSSGILLAVAWPSQVLALPGGMTPPLTRDSSSERSRLSVCLLDPYKDTAAAISGVYEK